VQIGSWQRCRGACSVINKMNRSKIFFVGFFLTFATIYNIKLLLQKPERDVVPNQLPASDSSLTSKRGLNDCLSRVGNVRDIKLYSQNDEDGALLQTLRCMGGHGTKEYFEFGSQSGSEVNSRILRDLYGWHGHLLDGSFENPDIPLHKEFFTPSNIVSLLEKYEVSKNLDVLSIDCDYDDLYTTREILLAGYKPRVLINEYNANFASEWSVSVFAKPVGKEEEVGWTGDCYFGASAMAFIALSKAFGYIPVFSNGVNLIFVRLDQALELEMIIPSVDNFPGPYAWAIHRNCYGRRWKLIDSDTMQTKATDPKISHWEFNELLPNLTLTTKEYQGSPPDRANAWRIFQEEKDA